MSICFYDVITKKDIDALQGQLVSAARRYVRCVGYLSVDDLQEDEDYLGAAYDVVQAAVEFYRGFSNRRLASGRPLSNAGEPLPPPQTWVGVLIRAAKALGYAYSEGRQTCGDIDAFLDAVKEMEQMRSRMVKQEVIIRLWQEGKSVKEIAKDYRRLGTRSQVREVIAELERESPVQVSSDDCGQRLHGQLDRLQIKSDVR